MGQPHRQEGWGDCEGVGPGGGIQQLLAHTTVLSICGTMPQWPTNLSAISDDRITAHVRTCTLQCEPIAGRLHPLLLRPLQWLAAVVAAGAAVVAAPAFALQLALHGAVHDHFHAAAAALHCLHCVGYGGSLVAAAHSTHHQEGGLIR